VYDESSLGADKRRSSLAAKQHGVIKAGQLGLSRGGIAKRVANGTLHRKYQGVYAYGHENLSQQGEWLAAVFAAGDGSALGALSAAVFWEVSRFRETTICVITPVQRRPQDGFRAITSKSLTRYDIRIRDGIPVTSVERTIVDLGRHLTAEQLANVLYRAAYLRLLNLPALQECMARVRPRHIKVLERAIALHLSGSAGTRSHLEDRFLKLTRGVKFPEPVINTDHHGVEVDFRWGSLCVEVDGGHHDLEPTKTDDRIKQAILEANGCTVVRFAEDEINAAPAAVLAALKRFMASER
jgi:very-short-patch-repair endonuclease